MENQKRKLALREKLKKRAAYELSTSQYLQTSKKYETVTKMILGVTVFSFVVGLSLCLLHWLR